MAEISGNLWEYNLAKVVVVDVSDDYRLMKSPMPSEFYPVVKELWLPTYQVGSSLPASSSQDGYLYDWHETPESFNEPWVVGVVQESLTKA